MKAILLIICFAMAMHTAKPTFAQHGPLNMEGIRSMPDDSAKIEAWLSQGRNPELAKEVMFACNDSAMALAVKLKDEFGIAQAHHGIANLHNQFGELDRALEHYNAALAIYIRQNKQADIAKIHNNLGVVKTSQAKFDEALDHLFKSLAIKESISDSATIAYTYNALGEAYATKGQYALAELYYLKAIEQFRAMGQAYFEHMLMLNLGGIYMTQEKYDESLRITMVAKAYFEKYGLLREIAVAYQILAGIHHGTGNLAESELAYHSAKAAFDSIGDNLMIIESQINLSEIAQLRGNAPRSIQNAREALGLARKIGSKNHVARALLRHSHHYKWQGDYQQALRYREQYELLNDTIFSDASEQRIAVLEKQYETRLKEQKLQELTVKNEMNELKVKKQQNRQYGFMGIAFFTVLLSALLFNQYLIKKRNHDILLQKNSLIEMSLNDKEILLKEIHHRVKNNMQFISSLLNLQSRHIQDKSTLSVLNQGKYRINSMALLHQKLYQENNLKGVEMRSYIENLLDSLLHSFNLDRNNLTVETDLDELILDIDSATPVALILNELITNAFKYGLNGQKPGRLTIRLNETPQKILVLSVKDNGPGIPAGFNLQESTQFGYMLIRSLAQKINGQIAIKNEEGALIKLSIHKYRKT